MNPIEEAVKVYGKDAQCKMAIEEMSELIKELCKSFRGADNLDHIAEEIADVSIMLEQLQIIFDCSAKVSSWRFFKVDRLADRIKKEVQKHEC